MANTREIYTEIFKVYEMEKTDITNRNGARNYIRKTFTLEFGLNDVKDWSTLTDKEKERFIYFTIKEKMLELYAPKEKRKEIRKHFDEYCEHKMFEAEKYNNIVSNMLHKTYYEANDSDKVKEKKYERFKYYLAYFIDKTSIPSYEEWVQDNERSLCTPILDPLTNKEIIRPLTIYDYIMNHNLQTWIQDDTETNSILPEELNAILIMVIKKIIFEELKIKIDVQRIRECLLFMRNYQHQDYELISDKEDAQKFEQYMQYKEMYDNLEFYEKIGKSVRHKTK